MIPSVQAVWRGQYLARRSELAHAPSLGQCRVIHLGSDRFQVLNAATSITFRWRSDVLFQVRHIERAQPVSGSGRVRARGCRFGIRRGLAPRGSAERGRVCDCVRAIAGLAVRGARSRRPIGLELSFQPESADRQRWSAIVREMSSASSPTTSGRTVSRCCRPKMAPGPIRSTARPDRIRPAVHVVRAHQHAAGRSRAGTPGDRWRPRVRARLHETAQDCGTIWLGRARRAARTATRPQKVNWLVGFLQPESNFQRHLKVMHVAILDMSPGGYDLEPVDLAKSPRCALKPGTDCSISPFR